ncbi:MAG: hypothetical protein CSB03_00180, partial [Bacteroidia bacterium]
HRYDLIPLLRSNPGGVKGSWSYGTYPNAKVVLFIELASVFAKLFFKHHLKIRIILCKTMK